MSHAASHLVRSGAPDACLTRDVCSVNLTSEAGAVDSIYWVISRGCNQRCPHCYNDWAPGAPGLTLERITHPELLHYGGMTARGDVDLAPRVPG